MLWLEPPPLLPASTQLASSQLSPPFSPPCPSPPEIVLGDLDERRDVLALEDPQGLLQALDLRLPARNLLLVGHHLGLALRLKLVQVGEHGVQLAANRGLVLVVVLQVRGDRGDLALFALDLGLLRG